MLLCCLSVVSLSAQPMTLTFTGRFANQYVPLSRVVVSNLTKGWQETLPWPDTVLVLSATGIQDVEMPCRASLQISQNTPNPFDGTTIVNLQVAEPGDVTVNVNDITGRIVGANHYSPEQPGLYQMCVTLSAPGLYFLTARQNGQSVSVKMVNQGNGGEGNITFTNIVETPYMASQTQTQTPQPKRAFRGSTDNPFEPGDQMEYVGFAMQNGEEVESSHTIQTQDASQTIALSFANTQPCPGVPTVTDVEGNVYNTVLIGSQCWMKENLRTTMFADGTPIPLGSYTTSDPNYYDDSTSYIPWVERGYLYNWAAAMRETTSSSAIPSGVQGVCPNGWHLPSDAEWMALKDYVASQPEYACSGNSNYTAKALASTSWWGNFSGDCGPGNQSDYPNNATGFGAVPVGTLMVYGYNDVGYYAHFWSSTEYENYTDVAYYYGVDYDGEDFYQAVTAKGRRASVRCLKD